MDIQKILSEMTLEEKVSLLQGKNAWYTVAAERLGIPSVMVSDGPHGLRKQDDTLENPGMNDAITAVCFPSAAGTAASFDRELLEFLGSNLGQECQAERVGVLLGPAANIKRSPLCGRNFEYFSEDPIVSGEMAAAWIRGIQKEGVGSCLKHFAANNQETDRMAVNETIGERALREIYLANFERAVRNGQPWTMMCSYNKINGSYSSENKWLLTDLLRDEWGFDGAVMTDWGACNDHVSGIDAGLELEMPRAGDDDDELVIEAVHSGRLSMDTVDRAAGRMLQLIDRVVSNHRTGEEFDRGMHHHMARRIARESMVLLKNDGGLLPIRGNKKVAFIGEFAEKPRYQGGGSSHITCSDVATALQSVRSVSPVTYAKGFNIKDNETDAALLKEAVELAKASDIAVLFIGLPDSWESEGYDRTTMAIPQNQSELIEAVAAVQKNTVVVLHNGSPIEMPWAERVPAILESYLAGQAGGGAVVDLLFGAVSPCGKLAETFPLRLEDTPCFLDFPGCDARVNYSEGIYVGYRYYDKRKMPVLFPFGHGLTYTTFEYSNLTVSSDVMNGGDLTVSCDIANTGSMTAKEIVQFYVRADHKGIDRPVRELKEFAKVSLEPGETKSVTVTLTSRDFSVWDESRGGWYAEPGLYQIEAAASSRDIRLAVPVTVDMPARRPYVTGDISLKFAMEIPGAAEALADFIKLISFSDICSDNLGEGTGMQEAMMQETPLHSFCSFSPATRADVAKVVDTLNDLIRKANGD